MAKCEALVPSAAAATNSSDAHASRARVLAALLARLGRQEDPWSLYEECEGNVSLERSAEVLRARGFEARVVDLTGTNLALLVRPTLVELEGGDVAVLVEVHKRHATLDVGGQTVAMPLGRALVRRALDRSFSAVTGSSTDRCSSVRGILMQLWHNDAALRRSVYLSLVYSAVLSLIGCAVPVLIATGLDAASTGDVPHTLGMVVLGAILSGAHRTHLLGLQQSAGRFLDARVGTTLRTALLARLVQIPLLDAERFAAGAGWQMLTFADRFAVGSLRFVTTAVWATLGVGYAVVVFMNVPVAAMALVGVGATLVVVNAFVAPGVVKRKRAAQVASERQRAELVDLIQGAPSSQVAAAQRSGVRRWLERLIEQGEANLARDWLECRLATLTGTVERVAIVGLLVWCGARALDGALTPGAALSAVGAGTTFLWSCSSLAEAMAAGAELRVLGGRLNEVLAIAPLPPVHALPKPCLRPGRPALELRDVYFRYGGEKPWILQGYNLCVEVGEDVVLRWPSGAGKSTLLRIMAGLVQPTQGIVTVAGVDPAYARALVAYLPQTTYLFAGSMMDNLTMLSGGATREALMATAIKTGLHDIVQSWPMGFETMVAWGGANLSGGERQLVAFTAAVASDRPIVLLDEALSNVDRLTQARFAQANLFEKKTVVRVVHETR